MAREPFHNVKFFIVPQTWYGRLFAAAAGVLLVVLLIFFFTLFLLIFAALAIIVSIYVFLFGRKVEETSSPNIIQVEYFHADPKGEPRDSDQENKSLPPG